MKKDCLMIHSMSTNTYNNAKDFSHNSIQGHHHSRLDVSRFADAGQVRWSMTVGCLLDPHSPAARYGASQKLKIPILGCGMLVGERASFLIISDLHLPYQHKDAFDFLDALNEYYQFDHILNVGDLYDHHRGSYHESEPDALSEEQEYYKAQEDAQELQSLFPDMIITHGNHDQIPQRKLRTVGLPTSMLSDYNKLYNTHDGWQWKHEHWFDSQGTYPVSVPMVTNKRNRWDQVIPRI